MAVRHRELLMGWIVGFRRRVHTLVELSARRRERRALPSTESLPDSEGPDLEHERLERNAAESSSDLQCSDGRVGATVTCGSADASDKLVESATTATSEGEDACSRTHTASDTQRRRSTVGARLRALMDYKAGSQNSGVNSQGQLTSQLEHRDAAAAHIP